METARVPGFGKPTIVPENLPRFAPIDVRKMRDWGLAIGAGTLIFLVTESMLRRMSPLSGRTIVGLSCVAGSTPIIGYRLLKSSRRPIRNRLPEAILKANSQGELGVQMDVDLVVLNKVDDAFELKLKMAECATQSIEWSLCYASGMSLTRALDAIEDRLAIYPQLKVHIMLSSVTLNGKQNQRLEKLANDFPRQFHYLVTQPLHDTSHQIIRKEEVHAK